MFFQLKKRFLLNHFFSTKLLSDFYLLLLKRFNFSTVWAMRNQYWEGVFFVTYKKLEVGLNNKERAILRYFQHKKAEQKTNFLKICSIRFEDITLNLENLVQKSTANYTRQKIFPFIFLKWVNLINPNFQIIASNVVICFNNQNIWSIICCNHSKQSISFIFNNVFAYDF